MKILTIETTGHFASVALGGRQIKNDTDYSHLQEITPMCMQILNEEQISGNELDAVAVSRGPGSFTGIRIGMATAKGLALIWNKPLICVPTLNSFAYRSEIRDTDFIVPVFDARRSQVYAGVYRGKQAVIEGGAYDIDEFKEKLLQLLNSHGLDFNSEGVLYYGDGAQLIGQAACGEQEASQVLALAEEMFKTGDVTDCYGAEPEYMRLAEAERKLKAQLGAETK